MKADAWMPLYVAEWDADTSAITCEEDGAYGRLVRYYWRKGAPPDDDARLALIVGLPIAKWRKVRFALEPFFKIDGGFWRHRRVERELERAASVVEARRAAGRMGGRPKKQTDTETESNGKANGLANGKQNETPSEVARPLPRTLPPEGSEVRTSDADGVVTLDPSRDSWRMAKLVLKERDGLSDDQAGKVFGKLLSEHGISARDMLSAVAAASANGTEDATAYLTKAAAGVARRLHDPKLTPSEKAARSNVP